MYGKIGELPDMDWVACVGGVLAFGIILLFDGIMEEMAPAKRRTNTIANIGASAILTFNWLITTTIYVLVKDQGFI